MSDNRQTKQDVAVDELYAEAAHWELNTGQETIHAKRISGKWRSYKWFSNAFWLLFFLGPLLRWGDRQAVLFDIPSRQFHILGITILPQDFWMLSLLLLFFAILLAVVTALVGRVWCGFFCFQTVWTDIYTWIEEKLEGSPPKRRKLEKAPLNFTKFRIKAVKHFLWLVIGFLTGMAFVSWFVDAYALWMGLFNFTLGSTAIITIGLFTAGTYGLAGFLREQTCFWLCPYARIQGVMVDNTTAVPTYDFYRGEPRGRVKKGQKEEDRKTGDCVDCNQCLAVCPTGVDIRHGQQEGCITCALCIDACDAVMVKLNRPTGLIRYESLDVLNAKESRPLLKRTRVWIYTFVLTLALAGIAYGLSTLDAIEIKVIHARQPLFVLQSDGSIQNKYTVKVLNKMTADMDVQLSVSGPQGVRMVGADEPVTSRHGKVTPRTLFVRVPREYVLEESRPIVFRAEGRDAQGQLFISERESVFFGPRR
ncbi:MAG: cytochrome c oxidase accessory protein CcoG [Gammaproteobacteria bacterium]|nr:cytochrome c oxidase accessory protein CcoG [Gammaproteobacteria bacterium]